MIVRLFVACAALACTSAALAGEGAREDPVDLVDPFIGTDGTGHTFPGASWPFAMVQPGPDNAESGWAYTSGYQYRAPRIIGFSQDRASGTGIPELGDVLLQPAAMRRDDLASTYAKASEVARPGYYAVTLADNGVRVELTSTLRAALHRYTFDHAGRVWVLVDLQHGLTFRTDHQPVLAVANRFAADGFEGHATRQNWATRQVAWSVRFSRPIAAMVPLPPRPASADRPADKAPRVLLGFDLGPGRQLLVKVGLATTDEAGARLNRGEIAGWDFDGVARSARMAWNRLLGRATITAPIAQRRIFATALYHALLHPSVISDRDGRWRGPDGTIRRVTGCLRYSTFSLWDTMRAGWQLDTLLVPERIDDFVNSLLDEASAAGRLPLWPIWGADTGTMVGEPALPVIADAAIKGFRGFDHHRALAAMLATASHDAGLSQWSLLDRYGYLPFDKVDGEAVSRTLELGTADAALARMAAALGDRADAAKYGARAGDWRNLIDPETHLVRGRDSAGRWRTPFDPLTPTSPLNNPGDYTEANAWQYLWTPALHDPQGLVAALGGKAATRQLLDRFFFGLPPTVGREYLGQEAMIGQDAHGNEPGHHVPWLYAFTDRPDAGHALVRRIATGFYHAAPDGIIGNDDAGQMSAWYVFATLGFYPVDIASGTYVAGIPLVDRARLAVPGHRTLIVARRGTGDHLARVAINGQAVPATAIPHRVLARGGTLTFVASGP